MIRRRVTAAVLALLSASAGFRPAARARARRAAPPRMVSERQIPQYKEMMELFTASAPALADLPAPVSGAMPHAHAHSPHDAIFVSHDGAKPSPEASIFATRPVEGLIHETRVPLLSASECDAIVAEAEELAAARGWTTTRHGNFPTTDLPLKELPRTLAFLNEHALPKRIYPMLADRFAGLLPDADGRCLRVVDAFVVKYDAAGGQTELKPHRDGSVFSFNIALNERCEYEGGGTWFAGIDRAFAIEKGHVLAHMSGMLHGGHPITSGTRYILVSFVVIQGYQNYAMRLMKSVWDH